MESPQNDFQQLTRLLHLKRFEVPPPGFHKRFRARVMTRIEMEREWSEQPWWHRSIAALTWQRGLAVANGVALAGVAFLAVATFHIANTVVNEEEEVQIYAALPLPGIPSTRGAQGRMAGENLLLADATTPRYSARRDTSGQSILVPVSDDAFSGVSPTPSAIAVSDDSSAPAWLFDPPSNLRREAPAPRFILPGRQKSTATGR